MAKLVHRRVEVPPIPIVKTPTIQPPNPPTPIPIPPTPIPIQVEKPRVKSPSPKKDLYVEHPIIYKRDSDMTVYHYNNGSLRAST